MKRCIFSSLNKCDSSATAFELYFWYTHEPLGEGIYQANASGYSMVYDKTALHTYFIPCHRKYSGQHCQCDIRTVHDRKAAAFLFSSGWLYFLWNSINNKYPNALTFYFKSALNEMFWNQRMKRGVSFFIQDIQ